MRRFLVLVSEEFNENFSPPLLEIMTFFFLLLPFTTFTMGTWGVTQTYFPGMPPPEATSLPAIVAFGLDFPIMMMQLIMSVTLAALIARSIAGAYESGLMRTFLSYPIRKSSLVLAKLIVPVMVLGSIVTGGMVAFVPISALSLLPLSSILGLIVSLWLTLLMVSTTTLMLALLFKRESMSMLLSVLVWFTLILFAPSIPDPLVRAIITPNVALVYAGLPGTSLSNIGVAEVLVGSSLVVTVMLLVSLVYSSRFMEY